MCEGTFATASAEGFPDATFAARYDTVLQFRASTRRGENPQHEPFTKLERAPNAREHYSAKPTMNFKRV